MESEIGPDAGGPPRSTEPDADSTPFAPVEPTPPVPPSPPFSPPPLSPPPLSPTPPMPPGPPMPPYAAQAWPAGGQMPPNPYGYLPYGYGYGYPQGPRGTNGMAIAALVLGICGFFFITPIIGLILGLVALAAVRKSGQKGKGLAISGIILSSVWIALFATIITIAIIVTPDPARRDADGTVVGKGAVSVFSLHPKDCFTLPNGLIGTKDANTRTFTVVPCATPHDSEAIGSFTAAEHSYPGVDGLRTESNAKCVAMLSSFLPDPASVPSGSRVQFVYPNQQAWGVGEHRVTCFLQFPAATMTQSVYRDASSYTADQQRFLNAVRPLSGALGQLGATPPSATLTDLQQHANDIADAIQNEVTALTSAPWPADVQPAIDALAADHRDATRLWTQAAGADDVTTFDDEARQANEAFDAADMKAARTALGLTTIGPVVTS